MRRLLAIVILLLVAAAVTLAGMVAVLNIGPGGRQVAGLLNRLVLDDTGLRLSWSRLKGTIFFGITLHDPLLVNASGDTVFSARQALVRHTPLDLLQGRVDLGRLEIDRPLFSIPAMRERGAADAAPEAKEARIERTATASRFTIGEMIIRDGRLVIDEVGGAETQGLVDSIDRIAFRGSLRIGTGGQVDVEVRRLTGRLQGWGLVIDQARGRVIYGHRKLWLAGVQMRTAASHGWAGGLLDFTGQDQSRLQVRIETSDLAEMGPVMGGAWAGRGPLEVRGALEGDMTRPRFELNGRGQLAGVELSRVQLIGHYTPEHTWVEIEGNAPVAESFTARVDLEPETGAGILRLTAAGIDLMDSPLAKPVTISSLTAGLFTESYDPLLEGGRVDLHLAGVEAFGTAADSIALVLNAGEGVLGSEGPLRVHGPGFDLEAWGWADIERDEVDFSFRGLTSEPSLPLLLLGVSMDSGEIDLDLRISGQISNPQVRGVMTLHELVMGEQHLASGRAEMEVERIFHGRTGRFTADLQALKGNGDLFLPAASLRGSVRDDTVTIQEVRGEWEEGWVLLQGNIAMVSDSLVAILDGGEVRHREINVEQVSGRLAVHREQGAGTFGLQAFSNGGLLQVSGRRMEDRTVQVYGDFQDLDLSLFSRSLEWAGTPEGLVNGNVSARIGRNIEAMDVRVVVVEPVVSGHRYQRAMIDGRYLLGTVSLDTLDVVGLPGEYARAHGTIHLPGAQAAEAAGTLEVAIELAGVQLKPFERYLNGHRLEGIIEGYAVTAGTLTEPRMNGYVQMVSGRIDTFVVEEVALEVHLTGQHLEVRGGKLSSQGFRGTFEGRLPMRLSLEPFQLEVDSTAPVQAVFQGRGDPTGFIQPVSRHIESLQGHLVADIRLDGTLDDPDLAGRVQLQNGQLKPSALGQTVRQLEIDLALEKNRIAIRRFTGQLPATIAPRRNPVDMVIGFFVGLWRRLWGRGAPVGVFNLYGGVELGAHEGIRWDLRLEGTRMGLSDPTGSIALAVDVPEVTLRSQAEQPHPLLDGRITVQQGMVDVGLLLRLLGGEQTAPVEAPEPAPLDINLNVDVPGTVRLRGGDQSQDVDADLRGSLLVVKSGTEPPYLLGSVETVPGRGQVRVFALRWRIEHGTATFGSVEEINPELDVRMTTNYQDDQIILEITGNVREPYTHFSTASGRLTSQSDIIELIMQGTVGLGQEGGIEQGISAFIETAVARIGEGTLGVDTVEIEGLGLGRGSLGEHTQITVGKYYHQLYLRYTWVGYGEQTVAGNEVGVEYRFSRRTSLSAVYNRLGRYLLEVRWRYEY